MLTSDSARLVMEDATVGKVAHDLTQIVRSDAKTDWQFKEQIHARLRTRIKRLLRLARLPARPGNRPPRI